jgi:predicted nucleic acid-binding protein
LNPVLVDTGGWVALVASRSPQHKETLAAFTQLARDRTPLLTTNYVLDETTTRLRYDHGLVVALRFLVQVEEAQALRRLRLAWVDQRVHEEAWRVLQGTRSLALSFTDATTVVLARGNRVQRIMTGDRNFQALGFELLPMRAEAKS